MSKLARIRANGGEVIRDGHRFLLRKGRLTTEAIDWVRERWRDVCREAWPEFDAWEERAAIREYLGGQCRDDAEAGAYLEVMGAVDMVAERFGISACQVSKIQSGQSWARLGGDKC